MNGADVEEKFRLLILWWLQGNIITAAYFCLHWLDIDWYLIESSLNSRWSYAWPYLKFGYAYHMTKPSWATIFGPFGSSHWEFGIQFEAWKFYEVTYATTLKTGWIACLTSNNWLWFLTLVVHCELYFIIFSWTWVWWVQILCSWVKAHMDTYKFNWFTFELKKLQEILNEVSRRSFSKKPFQNKVY